MSALYFSSVHVKHRVAMALHLIDKQSISEYKKSYIGQRFSLMEQTESDRSIQIDIMCLIPSMNKIPTLRRSSSACALSHQFYKRYLFGKSIRCGREGVSKIPLFENIKYITLIKDSSLSSNNSPQEIQTRSVSPTPLFYQDFF